MSDSDEEIHDCNSSDQSTLPEERLQYILPERIPKLFSTLAMEVEHIHHVANGGYNVVFGFTDISQGDHKDRILRVQIGESNRCTVRKMQNTAAIMDFLSTRVEAATKIIHMDVTESNPLLRPYSIHTRLPGVTFADAWDDMTLDDHTTVSKLIVDGLFELEKFTFPNPGKLVALPDSSVVTLENLHYFRDRLPLPEDPANVTVEGWLSHLLDWQVQKTDSGGLDYECLGEVKKVLKSMISRGYFVNLSTIKDCVLDHGDLHAGNVIVAQRSNTDLVAAEGVGLREWTLTGFVDWDCARSIPRILSRSPLEWLWCDHLDRDEDEELFLKWTGHLDFVPEENWKSMPEHMIELKRRVDHYACTVFPNYAEDAYGRGRWIRRVAKFAMEGFHDSREYKMLDWMIAEWAKVEIQDAINTPLPDADIDTGL